MRRYLPSILAAAMVCAVPALAAADGSPPGPARRRADGQSFQILANLGIGLPGGDIGLEGEVFLHPAFSLGFAGGPALGGPQLAGTARYRPVRYRLVGGTVALGAALGTSFGDFEVTSLFGGTATQPSTTWVNADAFAEIRLDAGPVLRVMGGNGWVAGHGTCRNSETDNNICNGMPDSLPYFGFAVGLIL